MISSKQRQSQDLELEGAKRDNVHKIKLIDWTKFFIILLLGFCCWAICCWAF